MSASANLDRPCTISESIMQSCKEVKSMREGIMQKRSPNDLFANIENLLTIYYKKDDNKIPTNQEIIELVENYCL